MTRLPRLLAAGAVAAGVLATAAPASAAPVCYITYVRGTLVGACVLYDGGLPAACVGYDYRVFCVPEG